MTFKFVFFVQWRLISFDVTSLYTNVPVYEATNEMESTWYSKKTDTGLVIKVHALAPDRYKRSLVSEIVQRIIRACSTWSFLHKCLEKAKKYKITINIRPYFMNQSSNERHTWSFSYQRKRLETKLRILRSRVWWYLPVSRKLDDSA